MEKRELEEVVENISNLSDTEKQKVIDGLFNLNNTQEKKGFKEWFCSFQSKRTKLCKNPLYHLGFTGVNALIAVIGSSVLMSSAFASTAAFVGIGMMGLGTVAGIRSLFKTVQTIPGYLKNRKKQKKLETSKYLPKFDKSLDNDLDQLINQRGAEQLKVDENQPNLSEQPSLEQQVEQSKVKEGQPNLSEDFSAEQSKDNEQLKPEFESAVEVEPSVEQSKPIKQYEKTNNKSTSYSYFDRMLGYSIESNKRIGFQHPDDSKYDEYNVLDSKISSQTQNPRFFGTKFTKAEDASRLYSNLGERNIKDELNKHRQEAYNVIIGLIENTPLSDSIVDKINNYKRRYNFSKTQLLNIDKLLIERQEQSINYFRSLSDNQEKTSKGR